MRTLFGSPLVKTIQCFVGPLLLALDMSIPHLETIVKSVSFISMFVSCLVFINNTWMTSFG